MKVKQIVYMDVFGKPLDWDGVFITGLMELPKAFYSPEWRDAYARTLLRLYPHNPEAVGRALHIDKPVWEWPSWLYELRRQVQKEIE